MSSFPELDELEAGLTALQNGQAAAAIAQLSHFLATQESDHPDVLKARLGLVRAFVQNGQTDDAIALCQELQLNQLEKVRLWATQMLAKLSPVDPGFVPLDAATQSIRRKRVERTPESTPAPIQPEPIAEAQPETISPEVPHVWKNAGRAQRWQALPRLNPAPLQRAKAGSAIALFSTLSGLWWVVGSIAWARFTVTTRLFRWSAEQPDQTIPVLQFGLSLLILFFISPWIIDAILQRLYGLKPLSTAAIARHSAETHRLIQRFSQQHKIPIPKLGILPTQTPIAFTYGCLPKFARIVVSQGLLDRLNEEEIAAIYAGECGHIAHGDFAWMSLITVVLQIPYTIYRQSAIVSDRLRKIKFNHAFVSRVIKLIAGIVVLISMIAYGFFALFRWSGLWLSKQRITYSDRYACDLTGNPNGFTRALIKTTIATAEAIKHEKQTHDLLESFELINPISYRSAVLFETLFDRVSLSTLFQWDFANRDRIGSGLNCSHSLLGDRLSKIMSYCHQWQLEPELEIEPTALTKPKKSALQFSPLFGSSIGIAIASLLWVIAQGLYAIGNFRLNWLASDYSLFPSFALIGFGIGLIMRFNHFFPESRDPQTDLVRLLTQPDLTLIESPVIQLEGTLIGRTGASNQLAQDVWLQTETGLIKLHYCSQFGVIGNLLRPMAIGQTAIVTGWLRRSATPWIDVDTVRTRSLLRDGHPTWSLFVAIATILLGIAQIL